MICVSLCFDPSTSTVDGPLRPVGPLSAMAVRQLTQVLGQELDSTLVVKSFPFRDDPRIRLLMWREGLAVVLDGPVRRYPPEYIDKLVAGLQREALPTLTTRNTGIRLREPWVPDPTAHTHLSMKDSTCF